MIRIQPRYLVNHPQHFDVMGVSFFTFRNSFPLECGREIMAYSFPPSIEYVGRFSSSEFGTYNELPKDL